MAGGKSHNLNCKKIPQENILLAGGFSVFTAHNGVQIIQNVYTFDVGGNDINRRCAVFIGVEAKYSTSQRSAGLTVGLGDAHRMNGHAGLRFIGMFGDGFIRPEQRCLVEQIGAVLLGIGLYRSHVLNCNRDGRRIDGLCVFAIGQAEVIGGAFKVVVIHPGDHDIKGIKTTVDHVPLSIVGACLFFFGPSTKVLPLAGIMGACNAMVVTTIQLDAVNPNLYAVEFYPQSIALGIGDGVVLDLLLAVIVGGIELNLEVRLKSESTDFINALSDMKGVSSAVLVSYNGDYLG